MEFTMKLRVHVTERKQNETKSEQGRYVEQHVSLRESHKIEFEQKKQQILPLITTPAFEFIDEWHEDAIIDIFASELVTGMSNNIADYVWNELLPEKYDVVMLPPHPARTLDEIGQYIKKFSNSSKLLKNIFATELARHSLDPRHDNIILHEGSKQTPMKASKVTDCMLNRGDASTPTNPLETIVDLAFPELLFCLRQLGRFRFSVASTKDHSTALATLVSPNHDVIEKLQKSEGRLTTNGEVLPSWKEYIALFATFLISSGMLALGIWQNWANRENALERLFDGVGLFGVVTGILFAIISRRLDFYDLVSIILRKKRFLESYAELLTILNLSDNELKSALTFEGVHVPPVARDWTSFSFIRHDGVFNPFSGLDTTAEDTNIIVGNKTALSRGRDIVKYYTVKESGRVHYLLPADTAMFRIVTDGDDKTVQ